MLAELLGDSEHQLIVRIVGASAGDGVFEVFESFVDPTLGEANLGARAVDLGIELKHIADIAFDGAVEEVFDLGGLAFNYGPGDNQGLDSVFLTRIVGGGFETVQQNTQQASR